MKVIYKVIVSVIAIFLCSSCSVHLAATGEESPDVSNLDVGSTRFDIESKIGQPVHYEDLEDGASVAIYEYKAGNEPSKKRAIMWLTSDILLGFIPELFATPYELMQGDTKKTKVVYNSDFKSIEFQKDYKEN